VAKARVALATIYSSAVSLKDDRTHDFQKRPEPAIQVILFVQRYIKVIKLWVRVSFRIRVRITVRIRVRVRVWVQMF